MDIAGDAMMGELREIRRQQVVTAAQDRRCSCAAPVQLMMYARASRSYTSSTTTTPMPTARIGSVPVETLGSTRS